MSPADVTETQGYILSEPLFVPIASRFCTGSYAIADGWCGKPWRTVCKRQLTI